MNFANSVRIISIILVLMPFATSGYFFDDIWNGLTKGTLIYFDKSIDQHFHFLYHIWTYENGRFFPMSLFTGVYGWYFLEDLFIARAYQLVLASLNVWMWFKIIKTLSRSNELAWASVVFLGLVIQFNPRWDGLSSFVALNQIVLVFIQLSLLCAIKAADSKRKLSKYSFLSLSLLSSMFSLLTYEVGILGPALVGLFFLFRLNKDRAVSLLGLIGVTALIVAYASILLYLRDLMVAGYDGTAFAPTLKSAQAFIAQVFSALPLANVDDVGDSLEYVGILRFVALYIIIFTSCFLVIGKTSVAFDGKTDNVPFLALMALATLTAPAFLVSVSGRYQNIISYGDPYIVVYVQYFGASLLLALLFFYVQDRFKFTGRKNMVFVGFVSLVMVLTITTNFGKIHAKNMHFKYPREQTEQLIGEGLLDDLASDSKIYADSVYMWESSNHNLDLCSAFFSQSLQRRIQCVTKTEFIQNMDRPDTPIYHLKRSTDHQGIEEFSFAGSEPVFIARFTGQSEFVLQTTGIRSKPFIELGDGFYGWELDGDTRFSWAEQRATLLIRSTSKESTVLDLKFVIHTTATQKFTVSLEGETILEQLVESGKPVVVEASVTSRPKINVLIIESEGKFWKPEVDPRKLYFQVRDVSVGYR